MERETAELLDKILKYLDKEDIKKQWLDILTDLEINICESENLFRHLILNAYITQNFTVGRSKKVVYITDKGKDFILLSSFTLLTEKENNENEFKKLQVDNMNLQNGLIDLQIKYQKRYIVYSGISFFGGFITANCKEILKFLRTAFQI